MKNIQDEVMKIHHQYGTTEMANYQIQLLFDRNYKQLESRIKELEQTIKNNTTELITEREDVFSGCFSEITKTKCCGIAPITNENYCPNCGRRIVR